MLPASRSRAFRQLRSIGFHDEERLAYTRIVDGFALSRDRDNPPARPQHVPGPSQRFTAYRVEYIVHFASGSSKRVVL